MGRRGEVDVQGVIRAPASQRNLTAAVGATMTGNTSATESINDKTTKSISGTRRSPVRSATTHDRDKGTGSDPVDPKNKNSAHKL